MQTTQIIGDKTIRMMKYKYPLSALNPRTGLQVSLLALSLGAWPALADNQQGDPDFVRDGVAGFVVSHIKFALGPDADKAGTCPAGMTMTLQEIFSARPGGKQRAEESDEQYGQRVESGIKVISTLPGGENVCMNPELAPPDPHYQTVQRSDVAVPGLDLDGVVSAEDFLGVDGSKGVDNQFYRAVGCNRSFQSSGQSNGFDVEMLSGSWGIVIRVEGLDDLRNDNDLVVHIAANDDPIQLSPTREPLSYATYSALDDTRFRATTRGRLVDGVLHTEPVDMRFFSVVNSMILERPLQHAKIQATLSADGKLNGYLAGYTPVEAMYDVSFAYRNGKTRQGDLAPLGLRMGSANGAAFVLGHTCNGVYHAMKQLADGLPDAKTGNYTAISTQYSFEALPAFVLHSQDQVTGEVSEMVEQHHGQ